MNREVFAVVKVFFPGRQFGFAAGENATDYHFHMATCRRVEAGKTDPEFTSGCSEWPKMGDGLVLTPDRRSPDPGKAWNAFQWGHRKYWDKAMALIAERPIYRVVGENRFKGKLMSAPTRNEVVEQGTLDKFRQFSRGVANDPLGTEEPYRSGPCQRINRWQRCTGKDGDKEVWGDCTDPRPIPTKTESGILVEVPAPSTASKSNEDEKELEKTGVRQVQKFKDRYTRAAVAKTPVTAA